MQETDMKCYTVTKDGVVPGIQTLREPYPHVAVGDPALSSVDYRRVEIDAAFAGSGDTINNCSYTIDTKNSGDRRSSYKIIAPTGSDDEKILVKFDVHGGAGQRTSYDFPHFTLALANGWHLAGQGPQVETPVNLVVLKEGDEVKIHRTVDIHKPDKLVFSVRFDGSELKQIHARPSV
jgi:hypothetical protein